MECSELESELRNYVPVGVGQFCPDLPNTMIWPRYEGRSVGNLAQTVAQALGCSLPDSLPGLDPELLGDCLHGVRRVVMLVMDALGWLQLQRVMAADRDLVFHQLAVQGQIVPMTTTFLSTTNSVLRKVVVIGTI